MRRSRWLPTIWLIVCVAALPGCHREDPRRHRLGTLQSACRFYSVDHGGAMPPNLRAIFPRYLNSESYLAYAEKEVDYFPGLTDESPPNSVMVRERKADSHGCRWVGYVDQSLELMRPDPSKPARP